MKQPHVFYLGRFWIGWFPRIHGLKWFSISRPGRGTYIQIGRVTVAWV